MAVSEDELSELNVPTEIVETLTDMGFNKWISVRALVRSKCEPLCCNWSLSKTMFLLCVYVVLALTAMILMAQWIGYKTTKTTMAFMIQSLCKSLPYYCLWCDTEGCMSKLNTLGL